MYIFATYAHTSIYICSPSSHSYMLHLYAYSHRHACTNRYMHCCNLDKCTQGQRNLYCHTDLDLGSHFTNGPGNRGSIPGQVIPKTLKMVIDTFSLNTQQYNVHTKDKVENPVKGVVPSPTPRYSSYWKGSFQVALDYGCQLYLLI